MIEEALHKIGLTDGEIRVYLTLMTLGSTTTGKITKYAGVSGSKVYEVLDRLMNKGLATTITKNGVKRFEATRPERLIDYLEEKEKVVLSQHCYNSTPLQKEERQHVSRPVSFVLLSHQQVFLDSIQSGQKLLVYTLNHKELQEIITLEP